MNKSFKTEIFPDSNTKTILDKAFGIRRFVWNWALNEYHNDITQYSNFYWDKKLNSIKDEKYPWMNEVFPKLRQEVLKDLNRSIKKYHDEQKKARSKNEKIDTDKFKPRFRKKNKDKETFRITFDNSHKPIKFISKRFITLRNGRGNSNLFKIKTAESFLFLNDSNNIKLCEATFSKYANHYYLSISYEKTNHMYIERKLPKNSCIGIDMGIKHPFTAYDYMGKVITCTLPNNLKKQEKITEKYQKKLSRKVKGSKNWYKILNKLQNSYLRENNIKKDDRFQTINNFVNNYQIIKIEGYPLNRQFNSKINRSMSRLGLYSFMEHLRFKCNEYKRELIEIPKGTPTTQTCCKCNNRLFKEDKLTLSQRVYHCKCCGNEIDRDLNAAINIYNY